MRTILAVVVVVVGCSTAPEVQTVSKSAEMPCRFTGSGRVKKMIQCHRDRARLANSLLRGDAVVWRSRHERTGIDTYSTDFSVCIGDKAVCKSDERAGVVVVKVGPVQESKKGLLSVIRDALSLVGLAGLLYLLI